LKRRTIARKEGGSLVKTCCRWCAEHDAELSKKNIRVMQEAIGRDEHVFEFPTSWDWELRIVARHGWVLMEMSPCDYTAYRRFAPTLVDVAASEVTGVDLLHLWSIAYLKWPPAVEFWAGRVRQSARRLAAFYHEQSVALARHLHDKRFAWMHQQISAGRQPHLLGAQRWLKGVCATERPANGRCSEKRAGAAIAARKRSRVARSVPTRPANVASKRRRGAGPVPTGSAIATDRVAPPPRAEDVAGTTMEQVNIPNSGNTVLQHDVIIAPSAWIKIMEYVHEMSPLRRPTEVQDVMPFAMAVQRFLHEFPGDFGMKGDGYVTAHIVRKLLDTLVPAELIAQLRVADLATMFPDEDDHLASLPRTWTGMDVECHVGVPYSMACCWTCLAGDIKPPEHRSMLETSASRDVLLASQRIARCHDGVEPNLATLAAEMCAERERDQRLRRGLGGG